MHFILPLYVPMLCEAKRKNDVGVLSRDGMTAEGWVSCSRHPFSLAATRGRILDGNSAPNPVCLWDGQRIASSGSHPIHNPIIMNTKVREPPSHLVSLLWQLQDPEDIIAVTQPLAIHH